MCPTSARAVGRTGILCLLLSRTTTSSSPLTGGTSSGSTQGSTFIPAWSSSFRSRAGTRLDQTKLFEMALEAFAMNDDLTNKVTEVLDDGSVHIRSWDADEHDLGHISKPKWR